MKRRNYSDMIAIAANQNVKERDFWLDKLSGELVKSHFPYDGERKIINKNQPGIDKLKFLIKGDLFSKFVKISKGRDHTLHMLLVAGVVVLLDKYDYNGNKDIIVAAPLYKQDIETDLINTVLTLRNSVKDEMTFKELTLQVRQTIIEAVENQNYPVEILVEQLGLQVSENDFPLFDVVILLENIHYKKNIQHIHPNVIFSFLRESESIRGVIEYSSLYEKTTIERLVKHFKVLMEQALFEVDLKLSAIHLLSGEEKKRIIFEFNKTKTDIVRDKGYAQSFEEAAARNPDKIAAIHNDQQISYGEVNIEVKRIAHGLLESRVKVRPNAIIALYLNRSIKMLTAIIGVFKAGCTYLPLDVDYPADRIKNILEDSEAQILITGRENLEKVNKIKNSLTHLQDIICLDHVNDNEKKPGLIAQDNAVVKSVLKNQPDNLAYIIYTSGTTGKPKGVMIHQVGMINHLYAKINELSIGQDDIIAQTASVCFDISIWQFLSALLVGGCTFIIAKHIVLKPKRFLHVLQKGKVTILETVPSLLKVFLETVEEEKDKELSYLRWMVPTGEALSVSLVREWYKHYPGIKIVNAYGPTEASDDVTHYIVNKIPPKTQQGIPIGKPLQNLHIYILDKHLSLCPVGVRGELCIAGIGVGKGYWKDIKKTEKSFIPNPYYNEIGDSDYAVLYRTGDIGYFREDGNIQCLGRIDDQVKIRGNRIELGEIENRLLCYKNIKEAVVILKENEGSDKYLCAYIVSSQEISLPELREYLSKKLPDYMIPAYFVQMEQMPLTPNGKLDKKALPEPEIEIGEEYRAPRNEREEKLVEIWSEVLGIEKKAIGIDSNFFQLGGYSLKATMAVVRIHKELNINLPLIDIFDTPTIRELAEKMEVLVEDKYASLEPTEEREYYSLSPAQRRLYILQQMENDNISYNMPYILSWGQSIEKEKLAGTLVKLIARHDSLKTSFETLAGNPVQKVHKDVEFALEYYEAVEGSGEEIINGFIRAFDLSQAPLLRMAFLETTRQEHILAIDMHHIITDGISIDNLTEEFLWLYSGKKLASLRLQYKDYSQWRDSNSQKQAVKEQENYWLKQLEGEIPVLDLPIDYPRPLILSFEGNMQNFTLDEEKTAELKGTAREEGVTLYMVLLAIYNIFLSRLSSQEDIVVGIPTAGRNHIDLEPIIGMFVNTLVLRNYPSSKKTFKTFLHQVQDRTLQALENQDYPFEELVEKLMPARDMSRNPLFDVMFALDEAPGTTVERAARENKIFEITRRVYKHRSSKFDLTLHTFERGEKLEFTFEYRTTLFREDTILRFIKYFKKIISAVTRNPEKKIAVIEIIPEEEKKQVLYEFNNTTTGHLKNKVIHELFERQVEKTPDNIAVIGSMVGGGLMASVSGASRHMHITYRELNAKSNQLSRLLLVKGVKPGIIVGIMVDRSVENGVGLLGILKAGAAYLPIDPAYPPARIYYMMMDSSIRLLLTAAPLEKKPGFDGEVIQLDKIPLGKKESTNPENFVGTGDLVYVIYTSGSTGRPKGVAVTHGSLWNYIHWRLKNYHYSDQDVTLQLLSHSFDGFASNFYSSLLSGGKLLVIGGERILDYEHIARVVNREKATNMSLVPGMYELLLDYCGSSALVALRFVVLAGEKTGGHLVRKSKERNPCIKLINEYGSTEGTVTSTAHFGIDETRPGVIGSPIANVWVYILDSEFHPRPLEVVGEIYISGIGLSRGYLNNPGLTSEKFKRWSPPPIKGNKEITKNRIYRTGDLARWLSDGNIEFSGRIDHQVKIRGYRVEPGEIKKQLLNHDDIQDAVVLTRSGNRNKGEEKALFAYIVSKKEFNTLQLREYLLKKLPPYMVPSRFAFLDNIPLTVNGKVDTKKLDSYEIKSDPGEAYAPPVSNMERIIANIWQDVLGLDMISVHDNFFDIGGHSLDVVKVNSRLKEVFKKDISVSTMFRYSTISLLAEYFTRGDSGMTPDTNQRIEESVNTMDEAVDVLFADEID